MSSPPTTWWSESMETHKRLLGHLLMHRWELMVPHSLDSSPLTCLERDYFSIIILCTSVSKGKVFVWSVLHSKKPELAQPVFMEIRRAPLPHSSQKGRAERQWEVSGRDKRKEDKYEKRLLGAHPRLVIYSLKDNSTEKVIFLLSQTLCLWLPKIIFLLWST